ncbi:hypothetical protein P12x_001007 [Tundrisphaera lichenicola]|uniref:hypothetical protein n=1 Tax=Tundrisphaera lichenicola TaxID=2029860 RepID=UPI003EBD8DD7
MVGWARWSLALVVIGVGLAASARWSLLAQERAAKAGPDHPSRTPVASIQDAMLRPIDLPFGEETPLESVRQYLAKALEAQVVFDRAALDRQDLIPEDTVQLDLKGVRLKVGLRLLLDQVGLTYRVEPEDNLLILTDSQSGEDPARRISAEMKDLHRDIHDLQDAVDDLRDLVEEDLGVEPEAINHQPMFVGRENPARRVPRPRKSRIRGQERDRNVSEIRTGVAG